MSIALRIVIFIAMFLVFIGSAVATLLMQKKKFGECFKSNIIGNVLFFITAVLLFIFLNPTLVFLSYNKMMILGMAFALYIVFNITLWNVKYLKFPFIVIEGLVLICAFMMSEGLLVNGFKELVDENTQPVKINPTIYIDCDEEVANKISIVARKDREGNIESYIYYYKNNNGEWCEDEIDVNSENLEIFYTDSEDSYIHKTITTSTYLLTEMKEPEEVKEEKYEYIMCINESQLYYVLA